MEKKNQLPHWDKDKRHVSSYFLNFTLIALWRRVKTYRVTVEYGATIMIEKQLRTMRVVSRDCNDKFYNGACVLHNHPVNAIVVLTSCIVILFGLWECIEHLMRATERHWLGWFIKP